MVGLGILVNIFIPDSGDGHVGINDDLICF